MTPVAPPRPALRETASGPMAVSSERLVVEQGRVIAKKYVLERPAGFGGMAQLWVATNQATGAEVCVKLLVPAEAEDDENDADRTLHEREAIERFRREAHAAARLSHRAIIRVFDLLELDERGEVAKGQTPYAYGIVMELLKGETLGDLLAKRGKLPLDEALDLFLPIVSALAHAHRASVVHRDIKPDNIFLAADPDGQVFPKVLDFGVSKLPSADALTIDGVLLGTPSFMSPEQARGRGQVDARSDVFSAAILFYLMVDGTNPFEDASFSSIVDAIVRREVPPIEGLPPEIWAVLQQALQKDPALRFNDATEMGIALRKAAGRKTTTGSMPNISIHPISSSRSAPVVEAEPPASTGAQDDVALAFALDDARRRRRAIVAGVIGVAAALIVGAVVMALRPPAPAAVAAPRPTQTAPSQPPAPPPREVEPAPTATVAPTPAVEAPHAQPTPPSRPTATQKRAPSSTAGAAGRKPGQEPHNARDPGF